MDALDALRDFLKGLPEGPVSEAHQKELLHLLVEAWPRLEGESEESMADYKVLRAEELTWEPPSTITFVVERHGPTALGSVYAELQSWRVDVEKATAQPCDAGRRLVRERDKRLDVKPIAQEVMQKIIDHDTASPSLRWITENKVRVLTGKLIPTNRETTAKRRKRLRERLNQLREPHGWRSTSPNIYEKTVRTAVSPNSGACGPEGS